MERDDKCVKEPYLAAREVAAPDADAARPYLCQQISGARQGQGLVHSGGRKRGAFVAVPE
jgi:hypothetical protein